MVSRSGIIKLTYGISNSDDDFTGYLSYNVVYRKTRKNQYIHVEKHHTKAVYIKGHREPRSANQI